LSTKRIKLVVSYDGTDFCGWAAQTGQRTVQSTLKEAVRQVSGEDVEITGASRTDSGAHAKGQVAHFDSKVAIEPEKWARVLNKVMEADVRIVSSRAAPKTFHSRFSAQDRWYRYRILIGQGDPFRSRFVHSHWKDLDLEVMRQAALALIGEHDFLAFTEELDPEIENTCRTLFGVKLSRARDEVWLDIVGTAFLRGMMRRMAGALFEVGRGHRGTEEVALLLDPRKRDSLQWPVVLPAKGLTLMRVRYGRHPKDNRK
jgi:tRNA pseudouridine38-40 synthase